MRSIIKHTILLIALALLSLSANFDYDGIQHYKAPHDVTQKGSSHFFSEARSNHYCTPRQNEVLTIVGNRLLPESTHHCTSHLWGYVPIFEKRINHVVAQYIFKSCWLYRSLTISDIIYPFAYFW